MNATRVQHMSTRDFVYSHAFIPDPLTNDNPPYVLIQYMPLPGGRVSYEDIEKAFGAQTFHDSMKKDIGSLNDVVGQVSFQTPTLDRATNRIFMSMSLNTDSPDPMRAFCIALLTNHGIVQVNSYSPGSSTVDPVQVAHSFANGITLDAGTSFVASSATNTVLSGALRGAIFGAIASVSVGVVVALMKRRKSAEAAVRIMDR
jgi:hypothetical protein